MSNYCTHKTLNDSGICDDCLGSIADPLPIRSSTVTGKGGLSRMTYHCSCGYRSNENWCSICAREIYSYKDPSLPTEVPTNEAGKPIEIKETETVIELLKEMNMRLEAIMKMMHGHLYPDRE